MCLKRFCTQTFSKIMWQDVLHFTCFTLHPHSGNHKGRNENTPDTCLHKKNGGKIQRSGCVVLRSLSFTLNRRHIHCNTALLYIHIQHTSHRQISVKYAVNKSMALNSCESLARYSWEILYLWNVHHIMTITEQRVKHLQVQLHFFLKVSLCDMMLCTGIPILSVL